MVELFQAQGQVLGHGHVGHEHEVLVHHADAPGIGIAGGAEVDRLAVHGDGPGVRLVEPHDDVHEGGLARTVLAHEGQHFAAANLQADVIAGQHTRETLGDAFQLELGDGFQCGHGKSWSGTVPAPDPARRVRCENRRLTTA